MDFRVGATAYLALAAWPLGDVGTRTRFDRWKRVRSRFEFAHVPTLAYARMSSQAMFEILRDDSAAVRRAAQAAVALAPGARSCVLSGRWCAFTRRWARPRSSAIGLRLGPASAGAGGIRRQGNKLSLPLYQGRARGNRSRAGDAEAALADASMQRWRWTERRRRALVRRRAHRIRGEILLKQNPADPAPAEAAFLAAIAVAQQQKARSFELRAALSLAKLYQSTGRPIDAHDVLGPALQGFSPTPEFPQIAEAKALFEALAADERVKADAARRAQRLKLQTNYGQAVMWSKGFAAEETKAAFARVGELATEIGDAEARLDAYYARWVHSFFRGELGSARETAESFLGEAERAARPTQVGVAHRILGLTLPLRKAISRRRGRISNRRCEFTTPSEIAKPSSASVRILTSGRPLIWLSRLGVSAKLDAHGSLSTRRTRAQSNPLMRRRLANMYIFKTIFEIVRDDAEAARRAAEAVRRAQPRARSCVYLALDRCPRPGRARSSAIETPARSSFDTRWRNTPVKATGSFCRSFEGCSRKSKPSGRRGSRPRRDRWSAGARGRNRRALVRRRTPSHPRRNPLQTKPRRPRPRRSRLPRRHRRRATAEGPQLRAARRAVAGQALSVDWPHDRRPRRSGAGAGGFSPTPEFPPIAEAKALLRGARRRLDEVKAASVSRVRQVQLQIALGNALIASRGYGVPETTAAFAKAQELAREIDDAAARSSIFYGLWAGSLVRGELEPLRSWPVHSCAT